MKKIYLYAMALGLMFASCEDFLTEYPLTITCLYILQILFMKKICQELV